MTNPSERARAAARRRAAEPDPGTYQPADHAIEHDHPGGRGACTPACPAWNDTDGRRRAVHPQRRTLAP